MNYVLWREGKIVDVVNIFFSFFFASMLFYIVLIAAGYGECLFFF